jgi:hypothetical protein
MGRTQPPGDRQQANLPNVGNGSTSDRNNSGVVRREISESGPLPKIRNVRAASAAEDRVVATYSRSNAPSRPSNGGIPVAVFTAFRPLDARLVDGESQGGSNSCPHRCDCNALGVFLGGVPFDPNRARIQGATGSSQIRWDTKGKNYNETAGGFASHFAPKSLILQAFGAP